MSHYELKPKFEQKGKKIIAQNYKDILTKLSNDLIVKIETYVGINPTLIKNELIKAGYDGEIVMTEDFVKLNSEEFRNVIFPNLTNDRVFGKLSTDDNFENYYDIKKIEMFMENIDKNKQYIFIGICSYLFGENGSIVYADIPRWELQLKYRNKEKVFFLNSIEEDKLKNFKRGYFIEWRWADRIKQNIWNKINYFLDTTSSDYPKLAFGSDIRKSVEEISQNPFRAVPYFDAGVWGGKWMEEKMKLGKNEFNRWAWAFDGVPEENSIMFMYDNDFIELPAIDIVLFQPLNLLGNKVFDLFGAEFPIRFDFLDTIEGQNLSLQVHPTDEYIKEYFNMPYSQNESYYMLDVNPKEDPITFLGFKDSIKKDDFINALSLAQKTGEINIEDYVNKIHVKKHDHLLHPSGVIHSSASGCMVLEISSTPYIFTFKLWDWGRLGLDGKPRPINIEHGANVLNFDYKTNKVMNELVNAFEIINDNDEYTEIHTGLHRTEQFIETRRFTIKTNKGVKINCNGSVNQLNLVEGEQAIIESENGKFKPLIVNYVETFIVPESCKSYIVKPHGPSLNKEIMVLQAYVR